MPVGAWVSGPVSERLHQLHGPSVEETSRCRGGLWGSFGTSRARLGGALPARAPEVPGDVPPSLIDAVRYLPGYMGYQ